ncbi:MAG: hypothetical protein J6Y16_11675 [Treponema sp.]|nr:hypothetical protein [Treponema sp.]
MSLYSEDSILPVYEQCSKIIRQLKRLARELKIVIVLTGSFSRIAAFEKPNLTHLRGCGEIECLCDVILFLHETENNVRKIIVAKNNRGNVGEEILSSDKQGDKI